MPLIRYTKDFDRWDPDGSPRWLRDGDAQADILTDLQCDGGDLSVWVVEDDRSNFGRIVAILALLFQSKPDVVNFVMVDESLVREMGVEIRRAAGDSVDREANDRWHVDLVRLSAVELGKLGTLLAKQGTLDRVAANEVARRIKQAADNGWLDAGLVAERGKGKLVSRAREFVERG